MPESDSTPLRSLPSQPNFAQLRKQAKELLKSYRVGDAASINEVERFERAPDPAAFALIDAQRVLARAYGFSSWAKLKQHVDGVNIETFCQAAEAGDVARVRKLAGTRPDLVHLERGGAFGEMTALHFAVLKGDAAMARTLMELGSDAHRGVWPHRDATAAYTMAKDRGNEEIVGIIEQMEERRRTELSPVGATISRQTDAIHKAILDGRCDEAIRLLESDLSLVGACDTNGATPIHIAAWKHHAEMVQWLIARQASVDARASHDVPPRGYQESNHAGWTSLDYAAIAAGWDSHGRAFCFLENSHVDPEQFHKTVDHLRMHGAILTPRTAVAIGDLQAVQQMHRDKRLRNDIHFYRGGLLSIAVRVNRIDMVSLLLDLGLDPDESITRADDGSRSWGMPLWFAAMCGRHEIASLLLDRDADVNAIVYACGDSLCNAYATDDEAMKTLLLERGARITVEHVAGQRDKETAKAILDGTVAGTSLNVENPSHTDLAEQLLWGAGGNEPEIVRMCLPYVARERDDPWWNYVLLHATSPESFQLVLEHGVDPNVLGTGGYTTLHHLATEHVSEENRLLLAMLLLDAGASLTLRDPILRSTPLGWACRWGRVALVRLYLERGADAGEPEAESWASPLAWAKKGGHAEINEILKAHEGG